MHEKLLMTINLGGGFSFLLIGNNELSQLIVFNFLFVQSVLLSSMKDTLSHWSRSPLARVVEHAEEGPYVIF